MFAIHLKTVPKEPHLEVLKMSHVLNFNVHSPSLFSLLSLSLSLSLGIQNHSYRSFQGFVCLMQISTRNHDYIIDTLELRHLMYRLLDPFTDPRIVKVTTPLFSHWSCDLVT